MSIENNLNDLLKQAMRDKDTQTASVVRMLKTKIMERRTAKGFHSTVDDALVTEVISSYKKACQKGLDEFVGLGQGEAEGAVQFRFEIAFCERFLPKTLGVAEVRALVQARIGELGIKSQKDIGRLMGAVMKSHKGQVDGADVKRIAAEILPA